MRFGLEAIGMDDAESLVAATGTALTSGDLRDMWRDLALYGQRVVSMEFRSKGQRSGGWADISFVTKLLRVKGRRGKYTSEDDVKGSRHNPMMDTGALRNSWTTGRSVDIGDDFGEVGTALKHAEELSKDHKSTFRFDSEKRARFNANVASGSSFYFATLAKLKKMDGRTYKVPARKMMPDDFPNGTDNRRIDQIIDLRIDAWMKRVGG